jgi:hypothetical protein
LGKTPTSETSIRPSNQSFGGCGKLSSHSSAFPVQKVCLVPIKTSCCQNRFIQSRPFRKDVVEENQLLTAFRKLTSTFRCFESTYIVYTPGCQASSSSFSALHLSTRKQTINKMGNNAVYVNTYYQATQDLTERGSDWYVSGAGHWH